MASRMTNMNQSFDDSMEEAKRMDYSGMLRYGHDMGLGDDAKEATKDEIKNSIRETNRFIQLTYED